jgi:TRAP-type mannitol/chloroaromatic compound transport system substrate-binding protein
MGAGALIAMSMALAPPTMSAEVKLKGIAAWPKNFPLVKLGFLRFVKQANEVGKGEFKIIHIGGPEIAKAPAQPEGFKAGLYDLMFTAASYHRGIIPEVDAFSGTLVRPWIAREKGGLAALNESVSAKINGQIISHTATSVSFLIYLRSKPKMTAAGMPDLSGLKLRSVPIYDSFLQGLGATTVTVHVPEIYNALERGIVDGFAFPELWTRTFGWAKFIKYRIYPKFYQLEPVIFANNDSLNKLSRNGKEILLKAGADFEIDEDKFWTPLVKEEREILNKEFGQQEIHLTGQAAKDYIALANKVPVERLAGLGTPIAKKLSEVYHGR